MLLRSIFLLLWISGLAYCGLFADVVKGIFKSPNSKTFVTAIPKDIVSGLQNDEQKAASFICSILNGDVPDAIKGLADDVAEEIKDDFSAIEDFIKSLPNLVPEVLQNILDDAEDVVDVVGQIFTNPAKAVTIIVDGVEKVFDKVLNAVESVGNFVSCLFKLKSCDDKGDDKSNDQVKQLRDKCQTALSQKTVTNDSKPAKSTTLSEISTTTVHDVLAITTSTVPSTTILLPTNAPTITITNNIPTQVPGSTVQPTMKTTIIIAAPQSTFATQVPNEAQSIGYDIWITAFAVCLAAGLVM